MSPRLHERFTTDELLKLTMEEFYSSILLVATIRVTDLGFYRVQTTTPSIEARHGKRYLGVYMPRTDAVDDLAYVFVVPKMTVGKYVRGELKDYAMAGEIARLLGRLREGLRERGLPEADWGDGMLWAYFTLFHELGHVVSYERRGLDPFDIERKALEDERVGRDIIARAKEEARYGSKEYYALESKYYRMTPAELEADEWAIAALVEFFADPAAFRLDAVDVDM